MEILKIDLQNPDSITLTKASQVLDSGGIVVYPTDTAYGLAADIFKPEAVEAIFQVKGRDFNKGLIVCVKDLTQAKTLVQFNAAAEKLFNNFLPGPLTLLLPKKPLVSDRVSGGSKNLAIRIPNCAVTLALSQNYLHPYTTTSANPSGMPNPYSLDDVLQQFDLASLKLLGLALDAGPLPKIPPSTIVDLSLPTPQIIRPGPISETEIFAALKET